MKKTNLNNSAILCISSFLTVFVAFTLMVAHKCQDKGLWGFKMADTVIVERTDTVWKTDTFKVVQPKPKYIEKIKVDTVFDKQGNEIELVTENKIYQDTILCEKDTAELRIFTSGIKSNVDSVNLRLRKSEIIRTNTIEITKYVEKRKKFLDRFHVGLQGGYGYGFNYKGLEPYVGIGLSFDL